MNTSKALNGRISPMLGTSHSNETKEKMSKTHLARKERLGYINSPETRIRMSLAAKGKYPSDEIRQKMSESRLKRKEQLGYLNSPEIRRKMRENRKDVSGRNNPNWCGGKSPKLYPPEFNEALKIQVKKRDKYTCLYPECEVTDDLTVHHTDYNKMNNKALNLVTLCRSHNTIVNNNRAYWEKHFQELSVG